MSEQPDQRTRGPRPPAPPETRFARHMSAVLMLVWAWWWWHGYHGGAYWIIGATAFFLIGEMAGFVFRPLNVIWIPLETVLRIVLWPLYYLGGWVRALIPEKYLGPLKDNKALSLKELNEAFDEAERLEEERKRRETPPSPPARDEANDGEDDAPRGRQ